MSMICLFEIMSIHVCEREHWVYNTLQYHIVPFNTTNGHSRVCRCISFYIDIPVSAIVTPSKVMESFSVFIRKRARLWQRCFLLLGVLCTLWFSHASIHMTSTSSIDQFANQSSVSCVSTMWGPQLFLFLVVGFHKPIVINY